MIVLAKKKKRNYLMQVEGKNRKKIKFSLAKIPKIILVSVNLFFLLGMLLSAYSPYFSPYKFANISLLGLAFPALVAINIIFFIVFIVLEKRMLLVSGLFFIVCLNPILTYFPLNLKSDSKEEGSLKVLSYNVMGFNFTEKKKGRNEVLEYVANSQADIICLQEYDEHTNSQFITKKDILFRLKEYKHYHILNRVNETGTGLACFSKYPIISAKRVKYKSSYNASMMYEIKIGNDTLLVINNHFESNRLNEKDKDDYEQIVTNRSKGETKTKVLNIAGKLKRANIIRAKQVDEVSKIIAKNVHRKIIVCGDFNDTPISYTHRQLTTHLKDAFVETGFGVSPSFYRKMIYVRIDNILLSQNITPIYCKVDNSISASDHYPIWCRIKL